MTVPCSPALPRARGIDRVGRHSGSRAARPTRRAARPGSRRRLLRLGVDGACGPAPAACAAPAWAARAWARASSRAPGMTGGGRLVAAAGCRSWRSGIPAAAGRPAAASTIAARSGGFISTGGGGSASRPPARPPARPAPCALPWADVAHHQLGGLDLGQRPAAADMEEDDQRQQRRAWPGVSGCLVGPADLRLGGAWRDFLAGVRRLTTAAATSQVPPLPPQKRQRSRCPAGAGDGSPTTGWRR